MDSDLWTRLARLQTCCDVSIHNNNGGNPRWICRVTRGKDESFEVSAASVPEAVLLAVTEAERRRWPG